MKRHLAGVLAILLCLGQSCSPLGNLTGGTGDTGGLDNGDDPGRDQPVTIPEGVYTGRGTTDFLLDNLSDAYPPEAGGTEATVSHEFDEDGNLLRRDGRPLAVGNTYSTDTDVGRVFETVTAINRASKIYQYETSAQLTLQGQSGLVWFFAGSGLYTYRSSGGNVIFDGELEMVSSVSGGVSYSARWTHSATLAP